MSLSTPVLDVVGRDVVSIDANQSIMDAIVVLSQSRFHHLPVVENKRLVGMVSTVDLLKLNGESLEHSGDESPARLASRTRVADVMVTEVIPVSERGTVEDAANLLSSGEFHALPVIAATGELIGIVTTTDLVRYLLETQTAQPLAREVQQRMQMLEQVFEAAQGYVDSGMSALSQESLERAVQALRWAA